MGYTMDMQRDHYIYMISAGAAQFFGVGICVCAGFWTGQDCEEKGICTL